MNIIVKLKNPNDNRIKGENYMWVNLHQIKKLSLKNNVVNPFVKTILFMLYSTLLTPKYKLLKGIIFSLGLLIV